MGNKGPVRYRKYTEEFKVEAIRLAESVGVGAAAKRLGVSDGNLRNWINRGRAGKLESAEFAKPVKRSLAEAEAENSRLRRELGRLSIMLCLRGSSSLFETGLEHGIQLRKRGKGGACAGSPAAIFQ